MIWRKFSNFRVLIDALTEVMIGISVKALSIGFAIALLTESVIVSLASWAITVFAGTAISRLDGGRVICSPNILIVASVTTVVTMPVERDEVAPGS